EQATGCNALLPPRRTDNTRDFAKHYEQLHCKETSTSIMPLSPENDSRALPSIAPDTRFASLAFIACPGVLEVTKRSPATMGPASLVTLQGTIPITAKGISSLAA